MINLLAILQNETLVDKPLINTTFNMCSHPGLVFFFKYFLKETNGSIHFTVVSNKSSPGPWPLCGDLSVGHTTSQKSSVSGSSVLSLSGIQSIWRAPHAHPSFGVTPTFREYDLWSQKTQIVKSRCYTKRRMGAATRAHPSFGMTTTKTLRSVFSWHTSYKDYFPRSKSWWQYYRSREFPT